MGINREPKDFQFLFLDMDSFFASVEQQVQPPLRGLPLAVAPYTGSTGCIIAASKKAKEIGIKTGTLVNEAKKIYPKIKIIEARPALYMLYHQEIKRVLESLSPFYQSLSIDEFAITLSPEEQNQAQAVKLAQEIKQRISKRVGDYLTCSIGIGPNTFLAKLAGEEQKPDGLIVIKLKQLKPFYNRLTLIDLTGINSQMERRLKELGIDSPLKLYLTPLSKLTNGLGVMGRSWYFRLRGYQLDQGLPKTKSIGHSHVLPPEFRSQAKALAVLRKLISKAGYRLRKGNFWAQGVSLSISFFNNYRFHRSQKTPPFSDNQSFLKYVFKLLNRCQWQDRPISVAVSAFDLVKSNDYQLSLLPEIERSRKISQTLDKINDKYGVNAIYPASIFLAKDTAPDRIPFGRPRYRIRE